MKLIERFKQFSALAALSGALSTAHAHPGHAINEYVHGLLHVEHILVLVAVASIAFAVFALRKK